MSLYMPERLYKLLPAFYRVRDVDQGEPLRALLAVIEGELERIEANTSVLYDNWFIETCDECDQLSGACHFGMRAHEVEIFLRHTFCGCNAKLAKRVPGVVHEIACALFSIGRRIARDNLIAARHINCGPAASDRSGSDQTDPLWMFEWKHFTSPRHTSGAVCRMSAN